MARSSIPGSMRSRVQLNIRVTGEERQQAAALAEQWQVPLGTAAYRLFQIGLRHPDEAALSDRALLIRELLHKGDSEEEVIRFTTRAWGLNRVQITQLLQEAKANA